MKKSLRDEHAKKKRTSKVTWIFFISILVIAIVIVKLSIRQGVTDSMDRTMPSGNDAFEMAKAFVRPTLGSVAFEFADGKYSYKKNADSVYVVKSYYETKLSGDEKIRTVFVLRFKYNGGLISDKQSWSVITLDKQQ